MSRILTGISSWADSGLIESGFYPPGIKTPAERLQYYSGRFPLAELDASFHHFPTKHNLDLWLENTPAGFTFDIKAFSLFTGHPTPPSSLPKSMRERYPELSEHEGNLYAHHLPEEALDDLWQGFVRTLQTVQIVGKLGAALFQFPHYFHPGEKSFAYLEQCRERLPGFTIAIEFRSGDWFAGERLESTLALLRKHELSLVCVDEPQGFKSSLPPVAEVTAPVGFVRFHGRNGEGWEGHSPREDRFKYLYKKRELNQWVPKIRSMAERTESLHIIFKNKYSDYPVRNALELTKLMG